MSVLTALAALGGVASCRELNAHGYPLRVIDRAVARGDVQRLRRGWIGLPETPADLTRAIRAGGTLTCVSALRRDEVWTNDDRRVHVRIARNGNLAARNGVRPPIAQMQRSGLVVHRTMMHQRFESDAVGGVDPIGVALAHAMMCQERLDAIASLDSCLHLGLVSFATVRTALAGLPADYADYIRFIDPRAESGLESHVRLGLRAVNIIARPQVGIEGVGRIDLLVGDRLIIETDGHKWHSKPEDVRRDKERDLAAAERGYLVLRLSYEQVLFEWPRVLAAVRSLVARNEHRWALRHRRGAILPL
jgi:very-short-patch-repair endonuclease